MSFTHYYLIFLHFYKLILNLFAEEEGGETDHGSLSDDSEPEKGKLDQNQSEVSKNKPMFGCFFISLICKL